MIYIISSSGTISGAEIVLRDYLLSTNERFVLCIPNLKEVTDFFSNIPSINDVYYLPSFMKKKKLRFFSRFSNLVVIFREYKFFKQLIKKKDIPKITGFYGSNVISSMSLGLLNKHSKTKYPILLHVHDMMTACSYTPVFKRTCKNMEIITVSEKCKKELIDYAGFSEHKVQVVYNGIDMKKFFPIISSEVGNPNIVIGYAGNIIYRKGVIDLAVAYKQVSKKYNNLFLKISYHLKDNDYFLKVENELINTDYIYEANTRDQMNIFYNSIDILVVPSLKDPLPTTVLEAMACGKIVIGSSVDGIPEMIDNEFLFEANNPESLELKISHIIDNFAYYSNSCKVRNPSIIKEKFSQEIKLAKIDKLFSNMGNIKK